MRGKKRFPSSFLVANMVLNSHAETVISLNDVQMRLGRFRFFFVLYFVAAGGLELV